MLCETMRIPTTASARAGPLELVEEHAGHVESGLLGDFLKAGGARDVDFGQVVADHVQADEQQAAGGELRTERLRDFEVACRQRPRHASAAGRQVAARLARLWNAREAVG